MSDRELLDAAYFAGKISYWWRDRRGGGYGIALPECGARRSIKMGELARVLDALPAHPRLAPAPKRMIKHGTGTT